MSSMIFPSTDPFSFGAYLRELRHQRGLTLEEVVERSNGLLSRTTLSIVEREDGIPNSRILEGLGKAYDLASPYLYAVAYLAQEKRSPEAIGGVWEEFRINLQQGDRAEKQQVSVPKVTRERLNLDAPEVQFYSVDSRCYVSLEAFRLGYVCAGDIIAVDSRQKPESGRLMLSAGWWHQRQHLLLYRAALDKSNVVVRLADGALTEECLEAISNVDPLGYVVWRAGALPGVAGYVS